jgi:hypothetical protein
VSDGQGCAAGPLQNCGSGAIIVPSTTDRTMRVLAAEAAHARLVAALREAGLGLLARRVSAHSGMIDDARIEILPLTPHEADALTAALRRARLGQ